MSGFWENGNVGLTTGAAAFTAGVTETAWMKLDLNKHPKKVTPVIILTPIGLINNTNTYVQQVVFDTSLNYWKWKGGLSNNGDPNGTVNASYVAISMWA